MFDNINYRILLIIFPIIGCSVAHLLANGANDIFIASDRLWCGLFAVSISTIMPNADKRWMILGTAISYSLMLYLLQIFLPDYQNSCICLALISPITCSIFSPSRNKNKATSIRLNYFMAAIFLLGISLGFIPLVLCLKRWIEYLINTSYHSTFYSENVSFIYGMIFQFLQTVGLGGIITELRTIAPEAQASISFYATTTVLNFCALPAVFIAIAINQNNRRRFFWGVFAATAFICPTSSTAISLLLLTLLIRYPFIYAFYMLLCIILYFIGQYIDFDISVVADKYYNPDLNITEISMLKPKLVLFATLSFITSLNFCNLVFQQNKEIRDYKSNAMPLVNAIKIDFEVTEEKPDFSFIAFQYIKALGGFNNINHCKKQNDLLIFKINNEQLIDHAWLKQQCIVNFYTKDNENYMELTIPENSAYIYKAILAYAKRLFLDLTTDYQDIPPYDLLKSDFKGQFLDNSKAKLS